MFTLDHFQFTLIHDTALMAESEEEPKKPIDEVKEESEKVEL